MTLPIWILVLCTGNSARSQMAEALLTVRGRGRVVAKSAGSRPASQVNPRALKALQDVGIAWPARVPRSIDAIADQHWDIVLTVCDNAREACPVFPGGTVMVHWGQPDPAAVLGTDLEQEIAFRDARNLIAARVDRLLALDFANLGLDAIRRELQGIGTVAPDYPHEAR